MRFLDSDSYYWLQAAPMPPKKKQAPSVTAVEVEDDCDSEGSEECSDPEDDIADEDLLEIQADFECVRGSARERVAPKTRYQYDLFMAIMARFFASEPELRKHASVTAPGREPLTLRDGAKRGGRTTRPRRATRLWLFEYR